MGGSWSSTGQAAAWMRLDARKGKNTVKDVSAKVLKCNVPLC